MAGAVTAIIQIDDMQPILIDQYIAGMKIAVQPDFARIARSFETRLYAIEHHFRNTLVGFAVVFWYEFVVEKEIH